MGRAPCCDKSKVKKGPWSQEEDMKLKDYIEKNGTGGNWIALPHKAGLKRCGKSCRLRWLNYLRPNIKHGAFSDDEDRIICTLFATIGSRWSIIAAQLPGRTDNDIKNYWNTKLKKKLLGIPPSKRKPNQQQQQQQQQQFMSSTDSFFENMMVSSTPSVMFGTSSGLEFDSRGSQRNIGFDDYCLYGSRSEEFAQILQYGNYGDINRNVMVSTSNSLHHLDQEYPNPAAGANMSLMITSTRDLDRAMYSYYYMNDA